MSQNRLGVNGDKNIHSARHSTAGTTAPGICTF